MSDIEFVARARELIEAGRELYNKGLVPATSGNFSARLSNDDIAITVSGRHKGRLELDDIMKLDRLGKSYDDRKSSAETALHLQIYKRFPQVNVILHPHGINATLVSRVTEGDLQLTGYELLKALTGVTTHETTVTIPQFENNQDIELLAKQVDARFDTFETLDNLPGYLIKAHGFYTWGKDIAHALRHVEALDFLFECEFRLKGARTS